MARKQETVVLSRGERLRKSQRQGTSMSLPLAIYHRLDLLTDAASDADATRAEVIGMLIAEAELDPDALERAVMRYRKLKVGEVVPEEPDEVDDLSEMAVADNVISIRKRGPGRPGRG